MRTWISGITILCFFSVPALAQAQNQDEDKQRVLEHVTAHPLSEEGLSVTVYVLEGDSLRQAASTSLGESLERLPGVHSAQFGTAVGRPVIRGLDGPRVRIMEDRIDTLDVSVTSSDHATTVEPFLAERIEVLSGPSILLYGSGAIGGIVDVHTGRIPHERAEKPFSARVEGRYIDNSSGYAAAGRADGGSGNIAWHVDALARRSNDYTTPVFAESRRLLEREGETAGDGRVLSGSRNEALNGAFGLSWLFDSGFAGFAVSGLTGMYGLPGGHAHGDGENAGFPTLDMQQARLDGEFSLVPDIDGLTEVNARFAVVGYRHKEIEPNGAVATEFRNDGFDSRLEATYDALGHAGALGVQFSNRNFSAVGEEAFIIPVATREIGAFWVGERTFGAVNVEAGARLSQVTHAPENLAERSFTPLAGSVGAVVRLSDSWRLGVNADYSRRAPVSEELYSAGPHLVTGTYERGNADLNEESALNISANLMADIASLKVEASLYRSGFTGFVFREHTGRTVDTLPEVSYQQSDAVFTGFDAHASFDLPETGELKTRIRAMFDRIVGERTGTQTQSLPRIPPWRAGVGVDLRWGGLSLAADYLRVAEVTSTAPNELGTDAYDDVSLWLQYRFEAARGSDATAFVRARNLTDAEQRDHTSFVKDVAPRPGRTIEVGLRIEL